MPLSRPAPLARGLGALAALAALACLTTGGCVPRAPEPAPSAPPPPVAAPVPVPAAAPVQAPITTQLPTPTYQSWMDAPQTPGDWHYRQVGTTTRASFAESAGAPLFEMTCEAGGRVLLMRQGTGGESLRILAETVERTLPAVAAQGAIVAAVNPRDPLLDAMAFSKGRFGVEAAGLPALYLPAWPEVTRVIEDCR